MSQPQSELSTGLSKAWALQNTGKHNDSVAEFEKLASKNPDDLDVMYGLGLAQKSAGLRDRALTTFTKLAEVVETQLAANPASDRFQMLTRMVQQRLSELGR